MVSAKNVYQHYLPAGQAEGVLPLVENQCVLEIGFGEGTLLKALAQKGNTVFGTDVGEDIVRKAKEMGFENVFLVDSSEKALPFNDDFFDAVYCYEVFEHLTNPYRLFVEIRRVLKAEHLLFFSVPTQEHSMGYGAGRHSFVYPGLLEKKNLERFIMQMYFKIDVYRENATGIINHRNYILKNMKQVNKPDIMEVIIKDFSVFELYGSILDSSSMQVEIERESEKYLLCFESAAKNNDADLFDRLLLALFPLSQDFIPIFTTIAVKLSQSGYRKWAEIILKRAREIGNLSKEMGERMDQADRFIFSLH